MKKALGLIETIGLVTAIEAADAAVKAACVTLLGYENTRGGGKITVKVVGDVGAVQAAVSAGVAAAERIGKVYSKLVIPRPSEEIDALIAAVARGKKPAPPPLASAPKPEPVAVAPIVEPEPCLEPEAPMAAEVDAVPAPVAEAVEEPEIPGPEAADDGPTEAPASASLNPTRGRSKPRGGKRR